MSPFLAKLALILCCAIILASLLLILNDIQTIKTDCEHYMKPNGQWRQHGDYWVWHDYINRDENFQDVESITLTSHGTYMDLDLLPILLKRWQAPISLAIYASGTDFDQTIQSLSYLAGCLSQSESMRRFLSIHLVIHRLHIPMNLKRFRYFAKIPLKLCASPAPFENSRQDLTYWHQAKLDYPVNLLRNIARYNAKTFYILALDLQLLPSPNFVKKFLKFVQMDNKYKPDRNTLYASVYCLPTFAHKPLAPLPQTKAQLVEILNDFNITDHIYDNYEMQKLWLQTQNSNDELGVLTSSSKMTMCVGYVSINEVEPLYDERCEMESIYDSGANLKAEVLIGLDYTFHILDGAFLIRRAQNSWKHIDPAKSACKTNSKLSTIWHTFYDNFLSLQT